MKPKASNRGDKKREMRNPKEVDSPKQGYRISGRLIKPTSETVFIEKTRKSKGMGRWIYCKYCYKSTQPMLSGINQVICSECSSGLTPDFFSIDSLKRYLKGEDFDKIKKDDLNSKESKAWHKAHGVDQ